MVVVMQHEGTAVKVTGVVAAVTTMAAEMPALLLSMERMRLRRSDHVQVGALTSKRASTEAWHGARTNSAQHTVGEIVLSRLLQGSTEGQIRPLAQGRYGEALLAELRGVMCGDGCRASPTYRTHHTYCHLAYAGARTTRSTGGRSAPIR